MDHCLGEGGVGWRGEGQTMQAMHSMYARRLGRSEQHQQPQNTAAGMKHNMKKCECLDGTGWDGWRWVDVSESGWYPRELIGCGVLQYKQGVVEA